MQQVILDASSDLRNVPRHTEALMFSIYLLATTSLSSQECESMFGEPRNDLLMKYAHGTQQALINAKFLKSLSLSTLHALCIYLVSCSTFSSFCSVAIPFKVLVVSHHNSTIVFVPLLIQHLSRRHIVAVGTDCFSLLFESPLTTNLTGSSPAVLCELHCGLESITTASPIIFLPLKPRSEGVHGGRYSS